MHPNENSLLSNDALKDEDLNQPGCCLILCILPWKPTSIQKYLIGAYGKKTAKRSRRNKSAKDDQFVAYQAITNGPEKETFGQKYYNTFHKRLPSVFTNRYDPLENFKSIPADRKKENEFSNETEENAQVVYDFSSGVFNVNSVTYYVTGQTSFQNRTNGLKLWPIRTRNGFPITLTNINESWMICQSESGNDFILCVLTSSNEILILAAVNETNNNLGVYNQTTLESRSIQRYIWRYESEVILQSRKFVLHCVGPDPQSSKMYIAALNNRLELTNDFQRAIDWHMG